jgi:inward rectifier potassium channel
MRLRAGWSQPPPPPLKRKPPSPVSIRSGKIEFLRTNSRAWEARDLYRSVLALSWPRFGLVALGVYVGLNLLFASLYLLGDGCIAEMPPGSFSSAFFYSVQTLSTVGFGHLYPATLYGDIVTTFEIVIGMFFTAVVTGLIFVRFSRPVARVLFSERIVIRKFDGKPSLQLRVANLQRQPMVEAEFRLMLIRKEHLPEEGDVRRFYDLKLEYDRLTLFPSALTIRHRIDESSPLHGVTPELLEQWSARFFTSIVCIDTVIPASVQSQQDYTWRDVHFDHRFVEIYHERDDGRMEVDYGRIHEIEEDPFR